MKTYNKEIHLKIYIYFHSSDLMCFQFLISCYMDPQNDSRQPHNSSSSLKIMLIGQFAFHIFCSVTPLWYVYLSEWIKSRGTSAPQSQPPPLHRLRFAYCQTFIYRNLPTPVSN